MQFITRKKNKVVRRWNALRAHFYFPTEKPQRLTIRWDSLKTNENEPSLDCFEELISEYVQRCGTSPVHILAMENGNDPQIWKLLKFAHRLDCQTKLVITGQGISEKEAEDIVYSGVDEVCLLIGGLSSRTHTDIVGVDIEESERALRCLLKTKEDLSTKISIEVPWIGEAYKEYQAIFDWAMELGVDFIRPQFPYFGREYSSMGASHKSIIRNLLQKFRIKNINLQLAQGLEESKGIKSPLGSSRIDVSRNGDVVIWYVYGYLFLSGKELPAIYNHNDNAVRPRIRTQYMLGKLIGVRGIGLIWGTGKVNEQLGLFQSNTGGLSSLWDRMPEYRREISQCSNVSWYPELHFWG
jgi:hypothetical protein